jgi:hypothetical protein
MAFEYFKSLFRSLGRSSSKKRKDPRETFTSGMTSVGSALNGWTDSRIDQVRAFRHWTYVAISRIADRIAMQIPNVGTRLDKPSKDKRLLDPTSKRKALSPTLRKTFK